jgi:hypothetical protein
VFFCAAAISANDRKLPMPVLVFVGRETMPKPLQLLLLLLQKICFWRDDDDDDDDEVLFILLFILLLLLLPRADDDDDECVRMNRAICREMLLNR